MVTEQDIKKELINLISLVDSIKEPIISKDAAEIKELSHSLSSKIHDKIECDDSTIVEIF